MTDTGFKIKKLRELHKLSQEELSIFLGVSQTTLSNIENGVTNSLDFEIVNKLCEKFDVGFDYFLTPSQNNAVTENNGGANVTGNNYGTINNNDQQLIEQVKQLIIGNEEKSQTIDALKKEISQLKKRS